jgi:uncharacterized protein
MSTAQQSEPGMGRNTASANRRGFLKTAGAVAGVSLLPEMFTGLESRLARGEDARRPGWGELRPTKDEATGLELLALPEGFRYLSFGWTKDPLNDGGVTPSAHDGMAVIASDGPNVTLCRNHEETLNRGPFFAKDKAYDDSCSGGCTNLVFDTVAGKLVKSWGAISGTTRNCAGGPTPWGTWLTCEETVTGVQQIHDLDGMRGQSPNKRNHGFIFEVGADGVTDPVPLAAMGRFVHEAVAVDPETGYVYETEDRKTAGFYRFVPKTKGKLADGGQLLMVKLVGLDDARGHVKSKVEYPVEWLPIPHPDRAHVPGADQSGAYSDGLGVFTQGKTQGGTTFARLEGCWHHAGKIYVNSTSGGRVGAGQVWEYDPAQEKMRVIFESPSAKTLDAPDNITVSPRGGLVLCEDGDIKPQRMHGLTLDGVLFPIAAANGVLKGERNGFKGDFRGSEWAGACFSPDGKWLFANLQEPGITVAITGPWAAGGL